MEFEAKIPFGISLQKLLPRLTVFGPSPILPREEFEG